MEPTILDIADEAGEDEAVSAVARALVKGLTSPARIVSELEARRGARHRALLQELVGGREGDRERS